MSLARLYFVSIMYHTQRLCMNMKVHLCLHTNTLCVQIGWLSWTIVIQYLLLNPKSEVTALFLLSVLTRPPPPIIHL